MTVYAAYESRCLVCDEAIQEGDEIKKVDDVWCHADCADRGWSGR